MRYGTAQYLPRGVTVPAGTDVPAAPSLFTALQEQLGLKLESTRAPLAVTLVASIDRPTAN